MPHTPSPDAGTVSRRSPGRSPTAGYIIEPSLAQPTLGRLLLGLVYQVSFNVRAGPLPMRIGDDECGCAEEARLDETNAQLAQRTLAASAEGVYKSTRTSKTPDAEFRSIAPEIDLFAVKQAGTILQFAKNASASINTLLKKV